MISQTTLIARLARRGIHATASGLSNDVRSHYLPPFPVDAAKISLDDKMIVARATRLYRLRNVGVHGEALRLLLFMADGWGWDQVRETCVCGFDKAVAEMQIGMLCNVRKPTLHNLECVAEDIAEWQERRLRRMVGVGESSIRVNADTMRFLWGSGIYGQPIRGGSLRTFKPLIKAFFPAADEPATIAAVACLELIYMLFVPSWNEMRDIIKRCDEASARRAVLSLRPFLLAIRQIVYRAAIAEGRPSHSTNPLTLFGHSHHMGKWPQRITPAQLLGMIIGVAIVADRLPTLLLSYFVEAIFA